jgi:hypothetical protein
MRKISLHRVSVVMLLFALSWQAPATAQQVPKDAAYWQAYAAATKRNDTVKVKLTRETLRGRLLETTADDMLIEPNRRLLRRQPLRRVRFEDVMTMTRTHPHRDAAISAGVGAGVGILAVLCLMWNAYR